MGNNNSLGKLYFVHYQNTKHPSIILKNQVPKLYAVEITI